ncbi:MAG: NnrU family protein [Rhizobiaceae bacterium]
MWALIAGIILFLAVHSIRVIAPDFRERMIENLGEMKWRGLYSIASIAGIAILVWGYGQARYDNVYIYSPPIWMNHLQSLLMLIAFIFFVASIVPDSRIKKTIGHPALLSVKIWAVGHLLVNGDLASLLLFGSFLAWAVITLINAKRREEVIIENVPALRNDIVVVAGGLVLWALFVFWLHELLIGVPVIA